MTILSCKIWYIELHDERHMTVVFNKNENWKLVPETTSTIASLIQVATSLKLRCKARVSITLLPSANPPNQSWQNLPHQQKSCKKDFKPNRLFRPCPFVSSLVRHIRAILRGAHLRRRRPLLSVAGGRVAVYWFNTICHSSHSHTRAFSPSSSSQSLKRLIIDTDEWTESDFISYFVASLFSQGLTLEPSQSPGI